MKSWLEKDCIFLLNLDEKMSTSMFIYDKRNHVGTEYIKKFQFTCLMFVVHVFAWFFLLHTEFILCVCHAYFKI